MKRNVLLLLVLLLTNYLRAGDIIGKDTTNSIKIKEIVVTASPKESKHFRQLPMNSFQQSLSMRCRPIR